MGLDGMDGSMGAGLMDPWLVLYYHYHVWLPVQMSHACHAMPCPALPMPHGRGIHFPLEHLSTYIYM
jgi:hypothetical protein